MNTHACAAEPHRASLRTAALVTALALLHAGEARGRQALDARPPAPLVEQRPPALPKGRPIFALNAGGVCSAGRLDHLDEHGSVWVSDPQGLGVHQLDADTLAVFRVAPGADPTLGPGGCSVARSLVQRPAAWRPSIEAQHQGLLLTVGGERFPGDPVSAAADSSAGDELKWRHATLKGLSFKLDDLATVVFVGGDVPDPGTPREDEVVLKNGDRFSGVVESIGEVARLSTGKGLAPTAISADRISSVRLANPPRPISKPLVWLNDGTVCAMSRLGSAMAFANAAPSLVALEIDPRRLLPLGALKPAEIAPVGGRLFADPPVRSANDDDLDLPGVFALDAPDLVFDGATQAMYRLPRDAERLVCTLALDPTAGVWGDCTVTIAAGDKGVKSQPAGGHLKWNDPPIGVNLPLAGAQTLVVRIDSGEHGSIRDRVRLMRPLVILSADSAKR